MYKKRYDIFKGRLRNGKSIEIIWKEIDNDKQHWYLGTYLLEVERQGRHWDVKPAIEDDGRKIWSMTYFYFLFS